MEYIQIILQLKSSFSVIDQMFTIEIKNAEKRRERNCPDFFYRKIKSPGDQNKFIKYILNPFVRENICKDRKKKRISFNFFILEIIYNINIL